MDDVARLPAADRADLFVATGTGRGLTSEMIEKDFWVCWALKRLFTLSEPPAKLLFKGGTSLSKAFEIIERFSEDVDLSFNRAGLGFMEESVVQRCHGNGAQAWPGTAGRNMPEGRSRTILASTRGRLQQGPG